MPLFLAEIDTGLQTSIGARQIDQHVILLRFVRHRPVIPAVQLSAAGLALGDLSHDAIALLVVAEELGDDLVAVVEERAREVDVVVDAVDLRVEAELGAALSVDLELDPFSGSVLESVLEDLLCREEVHG